MKSKKLIIIPIELYQREIYTGLYLSLSMIKHGYEVLICDQLNPILDSINGGVLFYKDHAKWSRNYLTKFYRRSTRIITHDTEGLITLEKKEYLNSRANKEVFEIVDAVLCWGENQKNILDLHFNEKFYLAGDPRFDVARLRKKSIKEEKISKILINTRFSYVNPPEGSPEKVLESFVNLGFINNDKELLKFKAIFENDQIIFNEFLKLFEMLKGTVYDIVIRPHPAEDKTFYEKFQCKNIRIDSESPLSKQISEADCIIHDGCTTAIEARAQGKVVIGLRPELKGVSYTEYANEFSNKNFLTSNALIEFLDKNDFLVNPLPIKSKDIYNFSEDNPLFSKTFFEVVESLNIMDCSYNTGLTFSYIKNFSRNVIYKVADKDIFNFMSNNDFVVNIKKYMKKFPELNFNSVENIANEISVEILKENPNFEIKKLNKKAFIIKGKQK